MNDEQKKALDEAYKKACAARAQIHNHPWGQTMSRRDFRQVALAETMLEDIMTLLYNAGGR